MGKRNTDIERVRQAARAGENTEISSQDLSRDDNKN